MTLDTRAITGATLLLLSLLIVHTDLTPWMRATGKTLAWCLRKLWWLGLVVLLVSVLILATVAILGIETFACLTGFAQQRQVALVMRRRHP